MRVNVCQCASVSQSSHLALLPPALVENDRGLLSSPSATAHQSKRKQTGHLCSASGPVLQWCEVWISQLGVNQTSLLGVREKPISCRSNLDGCCGSYWQGRRV